MSYGCCLKHTFTKEVRDLIIEHLPDILNGVIVAQEGEDIVG